MKKVLLGLLLIVIIALVLLTGITMLGLMVLMLFEEPINTSIVKIANAITE